MPCKPLNQLEQAFLEWNQSRSQNLEVALAPPEKDKKWEWINKWLQMSQSAISDRLWPYGWTNSLALGLVLRFITNTKNYSKCHFAPGAEARVWSRSQSPEPEEIENRPSQRYNKYNLPPGWAARGDPVPISVHVSIIYQQSELLYNGYCAHLFVCTLYILH